MFGERLAEARRAKGLSQSRLAVALGVSKSAVSRWERGTREPDLRTLSELVELLGVTYAELLSSGEA